MGVFKSYDIRGVYNQDWDKDLAYKIGFFLPQLIQAKAIGVGRDARISSEEVFAALTNGIMDSGCSVIDVGLCTTPSLYFATAFYEWDGSVMITASHNPAEYNGLKISRQQAQPVGYDTGLEELEKMVSDAVDPVPEKGSLSTLDLRSNYLAHLAEYQQGIGGIKAVIDCSDGMASILIHNVISGIPAELITMYDTPDGTFPHHAPNPLEEKNLADLKERTQVEKADLGICFDGDADRVMFIDETGAFVSPDLLIALLGLYFFRYTDRGQPGDGVSYDVRSSRAVVDYIQELGGKAMICKVGHSHAKKLLREIDGLFGGELAGHYYFRDNYYCDSAMIAMLIILSVLSHLKQEGVSFSQIIGKIKKYAYSGEINFKVEDKDRIIEAILAEYQALPDAKLTDIDGIRLDYPTWWFNLRKSNTEPYLRLVVEAETDEEMRERTEELRERIEGS